jgi:hypothetical protein
VTCSSASKFDSASLLPQVPPCLSIPYLSFCYSCFGCDLLIRTKSPASIAEKFKISPSLFERRPMLGFQVEYKEAVTSPKSTRPAQHCGYSRLLMPLYLSGGDDR